MDITERLIEAGNNQLQGLQLLCLTVSAANEIAELRWENQRLRQQIEQARLYLESTLPEGVAEEAFRPLPD